MKERWKWVPGYVGLYSVSNRGRVRSKDRRVPCRGDRTRLVKGRVLSPGASGTGYLTVSLAKEGKPKTMLVNRLVALAWIPNPDNLPFVMHLDDAPANNRVGNLQWGTHQDNMDDMTQKERGSKGETKGSAKLTDTKILRIRKLGSKGYTQRALAEKFNVTQPAIWNILHNKTWTHL